jgi:hypothetical protein
MRVQVDKSGADPAAFGVDLLGPKGHVDVRSHLTKATLVDEDVEHLARVLAHDEPLT